MDYKELIAPAIIAIGAEQSWMNRSSETINPARPKIHKEDYQ